LRLNKYKQLLAEAASNPRDYAILQVFLQTGVRVSELCALRIDDISFVTKTLIVREGKGSAGHEIECEKKVLSAVAAYLTVRPHAESDVLFLNRDHQPLGECGVRTLLAKYVNQAKLGKKASPHSLRHTFATFQAENNVARTNCSAGSGITALKAPRFMCTLASRTHAA
jgi:site-specific recombinase XerD